MATKNRSDSDNFDDELQTSADDVQLAMESGDWSVASQRLNKFLWLLVRKYKDPRMIKLLMDGLDLAVAIEASMRGVPLKDALKKRSKKVSHYTKELWKAKRREGKPN